MKLLIIIMTSIFLMQINGIAQVTKRIDQYLTEINSSHIVPGFSVTIVNEKGLIFSNGYGVEVLGKDRKFTDKSVLPVGSLAKSITALGVLKLVEQGKIQLNDPVIKYLPWFRCQNKDVSDQITIRMLINNTSGLYPASTGRNFDQSESSILQFVKNLSGIHLFKTPGTSYEYSNAGFIVGGLLISEVSGMLYSEFITKELLEPVAMNSTIVAPKELVGANLVTGHYPSNNHPIPAKREPEFELTEFLPAGSLLHSSSSDLGKYLTQLVNPDSKTISPTLKELLFTPNISFPGLSIEDGGDGKDFAYGLGWMISEIEGLSIIHHGGSTGRTSSFTMIDPVNKMAATFLTNYDMTFIDKYAFPTALNILNNCLRLCREAGISKYGLPTITDPTLNDYEITPQRLKHYTGTYELRKGGDDLVYFGVDLSIHETADHTVQGVIFRAMQDVNRFTLDFVNDGTAVTRNFNLPGQVKFQFKPGGDVKKIFFNNMEFVRINMENHGEQRQVHSDNGLISFRVPDSWTVRFNKEEFNTGNENGSFIVKGGTYNGQLNEDSLILRHLRARGMILRRGKISTEIIGGNKIWSERTFLAREGDEHIYLQLLTTKGAKRSVWVLFCDHTKKFTVNIQRYGNPLINSLRVSL